MAQDAGRDFCVQPLAALLDIFGVHRESCSQQLASRSRLLRKNRQLGPGRLGVHMIRRDGGDAAPVVDAGIYQVGEPA